ncbi:MAG: type I methionyl aminopeptidase [Clostridia bacterium]|nr:type I methionyl aminopeptidase [Clostridia bacterium]
MHKYRDTEKCWCKSGKLYKDCHKEFDIKLEELKKQGNIIPPHKWIKNDDQIKGIKEASRINTLILDRVTREIHEGMTTQDIDDIVMDETKKLGGIPSCLGYEGFPKSVCTSVNNVVCHGIPSKDVVLKSGDIVNVDCTTEVNGFFGDSSRMFEIGKVSKEAHRLVEVTKECLDIAVKNLKPWVSHLGDIGYYVSKHARENGYSVVRELGGHGVGLAMHEDPFVSHLGKMGEGVLLVPGMVFTIEPMINQGRAGVCIDDSDGWTVYTWDDSLSAQWEYTLVMTEHGLEILSK